MSKKNKKEHKTKAAQHKERMEEVVRQIQLEKPELIAMSPLNTTIHGQPFPSGSPEFPPLATPEQLQVANLAYAQMEQELKRPPFSPSRIDYTGGSGKVAGYDPNDTSWIQTFTGRRFNPTNPNPASITILDIAHALSMQCRFTGHTKQFYSIAQHSVLVSYMCDPSDRLWGLMHDASEFAITDLASPLKKSGKFPDYIECEKKLQRAICQRFGLPEIEPPSVKQADLLLLATEARDLMSPLHSDWKLAIEPLPFKIEPLPPTQAEDLFLKRFFELIGGDKDQYQHYLDQKSGK